MQRTVDKSKRISSTELSPSLIMSRKLLVLLKSSSWEAFLRNQLDRVSLNSMKVAIQSQRAKINQLLLNKKAVISPKRQY